MTPKSIGFFYLIRAITLWSLKTLGQRVLELLSGNGFHSSDYCDLNLWPTDPKINRGLLLSKGYQPYIMNFKEQHLSRATKIYVAAWCCSTEVRQYFVTLKQFTFYDNYHILKINENFDFIWINSFKCMYFLEIILAISQIPLTHLHSSSHNTRVIFTRVVIF